MPTNKGAVSLASLTDHVPSFRHNVSCAHTSLRPDSCNLNLFLLASDLCLKV